MKTGPFGIFSKEKNAVSLDPESESGGQNVVRDPRFFIPKSSEKANRSFLRNEFRSSSESSIESAPKFRSAFALPSDLRKKPKKEKSSTDQQTSSVSVKQMLAAAKPRVGAFLPYHKKEAFDRADFLGEPCSEFSFRVRPKGTFVRCDGPRSRGQLRKTGGPLRRPQFREDDLFTFANGFNAFVENLERAPALRVHAVLSIHNL